MPWKEIEQIEAQRSEPEGSFYLSGDVLARKFGQPRLAGKTYPTIAFPSGLIREVTMPSGNQSNIHLFGNVEISLISSRDVAAAHIMSTQLSNPAVMAETVSESALMIKNRETRRGYLLIFNDNRITDIVPYPQETMEILPGELRAVLPPIRTTDGKGWQAVAPLKIFTPDGNWTWYPTEFDGEDTFFGLVIGFEAELGYFSLKELESVRGLFGLPLERDLFYKPTTLQGVYDNLG